MEHQEENVQHGTNTSLVKRAMSNPSTISRFPSKREIVEAANLELKKAIEGEVNPLDMLGAVKSMKLYLEEIEKGLKNHDLAYEEALKHPEKKILYKNIEFLKTVTYTEYDFSNCNDPELEHLTKQLEEIKEQVKERQTLLKALTKPETFLDEDTGESVVVNPPIKRQTDGLRVSFSKE